MPQRSSGYLNAGSGLPFGGTFPQRIAGVMAQNPAAVVVAGGCNHAGDASQIMAAALAYYQALHAALPNTPIIVLGPWPGSTGPGASIIATENAISAAVTAFNDSLTKFIPVCTAAQAVIFGTGRTGATASNGNADYFIGGSDGTDTVHPTQAGHAYLGRWAAAKIRKAIEELARAL